MAVITLSASLGLAFALHEAPHEHAWSAQHLATATVARTAKP
jgi:hypothetical protein